MKRKQKTEIDFSKYRTPELVKTISEIISLPGAVKSIFFWAFYGFLAFVFLVAIWLKLTGNLTIIRTALFELYAVPAGVVAGIAVGCAEFVRRSVNNMRGLVNLLLDTTAQVTSDVQGLSSGDKELPPARDLVSDVYEQVIVVTLREACFGVFGFVGRPVYWFYHLTLNQLVRVTIKKVIPKTMKLNVPEATESIKKIGAIANKEVGVVLTSLRWTQGKLDAVGGWVKLLVLTPCYIVLGIIIAIILTPLSVFWWLV